MNDHPVIQKVRAFEQRHGPEKYSDGAAFYFADGAVRDADPIGALIEPPNASTPEGEYMLAQNKLTFARLKFAKAVSDYDELNTRLAHTIPADPDLEIAQLKRLAEVAKERKTLVEQAEGALQQTAVGRRRADMLRDLQEQTQRMAAFQQSRREVRI